jgi:hypothetical protein
VTRNLTIQGSSASVDMRAQAQLLTLYFVKERGRWKLNDVSSTAKVRYERALTTALTPDYEVPKGYNEFLAGRLSLDEADGLATFTFREIPRIQAQLEAVDPPAELADVHQAVVAAVRTVIKGVRMARDAQLANDRAAFKRASAQIRRGSEMVGSALGDVERAAANG